MEVDDKIIAHREPGWLTSCLHFLSVSSLCIALAAYLFNLLVSRRVASLSTDTLIYHLTIPAYWMQLGFLQTPDLPFHDGAAEHSPLITETLIYGLMSLTGNDSLAFLLQPAFFLLTVAIFHRSLRHLGLQKVAARFLAAFLLIFVPFFQSSLIVNSEMVMTCGVALFCYGMLLTQAYRHAGFPVAAAGIALTMASKTVGIIYGTLALVILASWFWAEIRKSRNDELPFRWRRTGVICLAILLCGLGFQFRNFWLHGNPLYPAELSLLGFPILPGRYNTSVFINHGWSPAVLGGMLVGGTQDYAMGYHFGIVLWLAMLVPLGMWVRRQWKPEDLLPMLLLVCFPLGSILVYFGVVPFWSEHRLLFPVYYLLWCGFGWSLHLLTRARSESVRELTAALVGLYFILLASAFLFLGEVPLWLLGAAGIAGIAIANYPRLLEWNWERPWVIPLVAAAAIIIGSPWWYPDLLREREQSRDSTYAQMYGPLGGAWNQLAELTAKEPATIAYSGTPLIYPLFGSKLANRVVYLPTHPQDQPNPVVLSKETTIYWQLAQARRAAADENYWLSQLQAKDVEFLLLVEDPKFEGVEFEKSIAARHPELLSLIFAQPGVWIYAVQPRKSGG